VGTLQGAVDRRDRGVEQLGDLRCLPAEDITQHEDGSLLRGQVLQGGHEREPDRLARLGDFGGVAVGRNHAGVGDRHDPRALGQLLAQQRGVGHLRGTHVHRAGPALLPAEHVEADVRHDAVKPRAQRRAALEAVVSPPRAQHRLLHGVLGLERRPEHAVGVRGQLTSVSLEIELQFLGRANHALHPTTDRR
jgi:hypothetical protein